MMKFVGELALNLKVATLTLTSAIGSFFAIVWLHIESAIPQMTAFVSLIVAIVIGVAHYCKLVRENRESRENSKLKELEMDLRRIEKEGELLQNEGDRLDNIQKDLTIQEQRLRIKQLEKSISEGKKED